MFSSLKLKLLLGLYVFILVSIPVGAYLASQHQSVKSKASETAAKPTVQQKPKTKQSPAKELLSAAESNLPSTSKPSPTPESSSPTIASSFGPTLSLKASLEGRTSDQATKLFVGIIEGGLSSNPKFLLSFTIDLPKSGEYSNLSLAGLTSGNKYTAILKGTAQIATASSFIMSPAVTNLNDGKAVNMLSGDLNEDNLINSSDYSIAKQALNSTSKSSNWNTNADLNKDGFVNLFDLTIISRNIGQTGATGVWTSPIPKSSTPSASISSPQGAVGGYQQAVTSGYWIWIPQ